MQAERASLPCPACGEDPEHGVTQDGKHVLFCNEHLTIKAEGKTKLEAMANWNREYWGKTFSQEHDPDEAEKDDDND